MKQLIGGYLEVLECINQEALEKYEKSEFKDKKMFITSSFAENLLTDLKLIINLYNTYEVRHIASIFKTSIEHIMLYGYLIKYPSEIDKYLGGNIKEHILKEDDDLVKEFKKNIGQYRFRREKIKGIARDIEEDKSIENKMCVYDAYRMLCDYAHDGYFMQILHQVGQNEVGEEQEKQNHELDLFILTGLNYFAQVVEKQVLI